MADIARIYSKLKKSVIDYDVPVVDLIKFQTNDAFKVLVTTILSARTNDKTTLTAAKKIFSKIKTKKDLAKLSEDQIRKLIYPVGFYRNKAKYLAALPNALDNLNDGKIPQTVDELIKLPGVGRKTANLVVAVAFLKPAICVDIHVHRIMNRIGYVKTKTPYETEMKLRSKLPKKYWTSFNSIFVAHGQNICRPIRPKCLECVINKECKKIIKKN